MRRKKPIFGGNLNTMSIALLYMQLNTSSRRRKPTVLNRKLLEAVKQQFKILQ